MSAAPTSAEPTPTAAAPARRNAGVFAVSTPPVARSGTLPSGPRRSRTNSGPSRAAGNNFTNSAPSRHAVSTSVGVIAPGIAGSPASRHAASTSGTSPGPTQACAPAATAARTSSAVRTVPARTTSCGSLRKLAIVSSASGESSVISTTPIPLRAAHGRPSPDPRRAAGSRPRVGFGSPRSPHSRCETLRR